MNKLLEGERMCVSMSSQYVDKAVTTIQRVAPRIHKRSFTDPREQDHAIPILHVEMDEWIIL